MFSQLAVLALAALSASALTTPERRQATCSTGPVQCCNSVQPAGSPAASNLLALVGVVVQDVNVAVGITCTPITVIGGGAAGSCSQQSVCCEDNSFEGVIAIGCTPVS